MLNFEKHLEEVADKVTSRLIRCLAGTTWGASAKCYASPLEHGSSLLLNNRPLSVREALLRVNQMEMLSELNIMFPSEFH